MSKESSLDPLAELYRATPIGAATFLALTARARLEDAAEITDAFLKMLLLTLIIPAEALTRRLILALAAKLGQPQRRAPSPAPPTRLVPPPAPGAPPPAEPIPVPAFRLIESLPLGKRGAPKAGHTPSGRAALHRAPGENRLFGQVYGRLNSVFFALRNLDAQARRFLLRRPHLAARNRPPLAFGHPPGEKAVAAAPDISAHLARTDTEAADAWNRLCDSS